MLSRGVVVVDSAGVALKRGELALSSGVVAVLSMGVAVVSKGVPIQIRGEESSTEALEKSFLFSARSWLFDASLLTSIASCSWQSGVAVNDASALAADDQNPSTSALAKEMMVSCGMVLLLLAKRGSEVDLNKDMEGGSLVAWLTWEHEYIFYWDSAIPFLHSFFSHNFSFLSFIPFLFFFPLSTFLTMFLHKF